jgi:hypothetical protein
MRMFKDWNQPEEGMAQPDDLHMLSTKRGFFSPT